jgi:hypothetical protein
MAEGQAIARIAAAHPGDDDVQGHCRIASLLEHWRRHGAAHDALRDRVVRREAEAARSADLAELWLDYRACFELDRAKGVVDAGYWAVPARLP